MPNPVPPAYAQPPTWGNGRFSNGSAQVVVRSQGAFQPYSLDVPGLMTHTGGVIGGNGIINGHSFTQGDVGVASWAPGSSPGTLTIHGDMTFGDRSLVLLQAEVDGAGFLAWDHMIADRMTFLSGSVIRLALGPGTELRLGESSELLTCTVACDFSGARFEITGATGAQILQGALGLTVTLAPVPEPAHWALLLAGLAMVTGFRQRGRAERTIASPRQL
ncbi:MAG: PEP-CTERM sorting domain-containing protein [Rhodoferax sp.]